jgi:hypothetical protein
MNLQIFQNIDYIRYQKMILFERNCEVKKFRLKSKQKKILNKEI